MDPVPDISLPIPGAPDQGDTAAAERLGRRAGGIGLSRGRQDDDPAEAIAQFWWPVPGHGWVVWGCLGPLAGRLEILRLRFEPCVPGIAATPDLLRAVSFTAITTAAEAAFAFGARQERQLSAMFGVEPRPGMADPAARPTGQGRPRLSDALLQETAEAYLEEQKHGAGIYDRIALRLKHKFKREFSESKVRTAIRRAQADQWLTAARPGPRAHRGAGPHLLEAWGQRSI